MPMCFTDCNAFIRHINWQLVQYFPFVLVLKQIKCMNEISDEIGCCVLLLQHLKCLFEFLYSWIVNVSCLPRLFSKRFGGLMSIIAVIPIDTANEITNITNTPDQIGADVKPIQSYESLNRLEPTSSCTYEQKIYIALDKLHDTHTQSIYLHGM